jgi:signal transduction histidine kinase
MILTTISISIYYKLNTFSHNILLNRRLLMATGKIASVLLIMLFLIAPTAFSSDLSKHDEIKKAVNHGVNVIKSTGKTGINQLKDFRFGDGEGYLLVTDINGVMIFNAALPELVGKDMSVIQDLKGKYFFAEMKAKYEKDGYGWTSYWWPNPKTKAAGHKCTYFMKTTMDGKPVVVMGGLYDISEDDCR